MNQINISRFFIFTITISLIITLVSRCSNIPENLIWRLVDEIQRTYFPNKEINNKILKDPEKLKKRIEANVDSAISVYKKQTNFQEEVRVPQPRYIELPSDGSRAQNLLGGEMRLCAPWVPDCPPESTVYPE
jgi:hypothetical protein